MHKYWRGTPRPRVNAIVTLKKHALLLLLVDSAIEFPLHEAEENMYSTYEFMIGGYLDGWLVRRHGRVSRGSL